MIKMVGIHGSVKAESGIGAGMRRHGDSYERAYLGSDAVKEADGFMQINFLKPKSATINKDGPYEYILDTKKPFLVKESPVFRKYPHYKRLGWWSYKWAEGEFGNKNAPNDRWNQFQKDTGIVLKDWKSPGDKIIIMGQKEGDSSLVDLYNNGYRSYYTWVQELVTQIRKYSDRDIIIRPHPRNMKGGLKGAHSIKGKNIFVSSNLTQGGNQGGEGLDADFKQAHCVVPYNSLSSVEAVVRGIPVIALDGGCMTWPIAHKSLSDIENINYNIDIQEWKNKIAYTFWNKLEVKSGECWDHLKAVYKKD